jgi:hypothetical protein
MAVSFPDYFFVTDLGEEISNVNSNYSYKVHKIFKEKFAKIVENRGHRIDAWSLCQFQTLLPLRRVRPLPLARLDRFGRGKDGQRRRARGHQVGSHYSWLF